MKSCDETVDTVLERVHRYKSVQAQRRKVLQTALPLCMLLAVLTGFGLWQGGQFSASSPLTPNPASYMPGTAAIRTRSDGSAPQSDTDRLGWLIVQGRYYLQDTESPLSPETEECLGLASSFEGFYRDNTEIDGTVYTVKGHNDLLYLTLTNGGSVLLKETTSFQGAVANAAE